MTEDMLEAGLVPSLGSVAQITERGGEGPRPLRPIANRGEQFFPWHGDGEIQQVTPVTGSFEE